MPDKISPRHPRKERGGERNLLARAIHFFVITAIASAIAVKDFVPGILLWLVRRHDFNLPSHTNTEVCSRNGNTAGGSLHTCFQEATSIAQRLTFITHCGVQQPHEMLFFIWRR
jgi:hypothetical protein